MGQLSCVWSCARLYLFLFSFFFKSGTSKAALLPYKFRYARLGFDLHNAAVDRLERCEKCERVYLIRALGWVTCLANGRACLYLGGHYVDLLFGARNGASLFCSSAFNTSRGILVHRKQKANDIVKSNWSTFRFLSLFLDAGVRFIEMLRVIKDNVD